MLVSDTPRAVVTTRWDARTYQQRQINEISEFFVDTSLDNDADVWTVKIPDPRGLLIAPLISRDNEIRVQLYGHGIQQNGVQWLATGFADDVEFSEDGEIMLTGRDMSSLATDSTVPPQQFKWIRSWDIIGKQAREIGLNGRLNLARAGIIKKVQFTDGSESYWEFWHRLARKDKQYIWAGPEGSLNMGALNYGAAPVVTFGTGGIPVERLEIRKSTQSRVGEVWVFGHRGDNGFNVIVKDRSMDGWQKRPRKIMLDTDARTPKMAEKTGNEEIYEGKVGSVEFIVTVISPQGLFVQPNTIARINIPEVGISGEFFVVGTRVGSSDAGHIQEIRLRERNYAISRRTPTDPKPPETPGKGTQPELGNSLDTVAGIRWGQYFVTAANKHHGPWDYGLFLATLVAICDQETGFRNVRSNGGPGGSGIEWYDWRPSQTTSFPVRDSNGRTQQEWREIFANEPGPFTGATWAVGPMQLYSLNYKHWADDMAGSGRRDQYEGGRWNPEFNIMAAARALREKLQIAAHDSGRDIDMWGGVSLYGHNAHLYQPGKPTPYAISVKNKVYNDPGYLGLVRNAIKDARDAADAARDGDTDTALGDDPDIVFQGLPDRSQALAIIRNMSPFPSELEKRRAIVAAAMYGYYNRDVISYTQNTQRMQDFGPPPNVPGATDCSAFATWCYKSARAPDPNGLGYNGTGYTGTLIGRGRAKTSVGQLSPGDLVFYGDSFGSTGHVAVYVGNSQVVSHGSQPGPLLLKVNYRTITGMRDYL